MSPGKVAAFQRGRQGLSSPVSGHPHQERFADCTGNQTPQGNGEGVLSAMLSDTLHAALEYRKDALNRIRVSIPANVLFRRVVHRFMTGELFP